MSRPLLDRLGSDFFARVPAVPGVYLMLGARAELLYVGKAKNLRTRLRSYARIDDADRGKLVALVRAVRSIRWEACATEASALARETELLRAMRPPFNFTHTDRSSYLGIAVQDRPDAVHVHLTDDPVGVQGKGYGCYPFEAATPDAYAAMLRVLALVAPGRQVPVSGRVNRAKGLTVRITPEVRRSLHAFLSGRSPRLVRELDELIAADAGIDAPVLRAARRDLETLQTFYATGPRTMRRLQRKQGGPPGPLSGVDLTRLMAADLQTQVGAGAHADRDAVERRIAELRERGLGLRAIAVQLNRESLSRARGGGRWRAADVAEVVGEQLAQATRSSALADAHHRPSGGAPAGASAADPPD